MSIEKLVLASTSQRRHELMKLSGIPFEIYVPKVDETCFGTPDTQVMEIAKRKALYCAQNMSNRTIIAADTLVAIDDLVLGKPRDAQDAFKMLSILNGRTHQVYTGVCLVNNGTIDADYALTDVTFAELTEFEIRHYIASKEPMDKAGSYAIQGMGGMFIEKINGSYSNVIGMPMSLVRRMLIKQSKMDYISC